MEDNRYDEKIDVKEQKNTSELAASPTETTSSSESTNVDETAPELSNKSADTEETEKEGGTFSSRALGATGAVAAVAVFVIITVTSIVANFTHFMQYATFFDYAIETTVEFTVEDGYSGLNYNNFDTGLRLITYNDFYDNIVILSTDNPDLSYEIISESYNEKDRSGKIKMRFSGKVLGLTSNTKYKTQIIGENNDGTVKVYDEKTFITTGLKTSFDKVEWICQCSIDGNFYYTLKYIDENGYYSDFKYALKSVKSGEIASFGDIVDSAKEQAIYVKDLPGSDYILIITYNSTDPKDVAKGNSTVTIEINVKI